MILLPYIHLRPTETKFLVFVLFLLSPSNSDQKERKRDMSIERKREFLVRESEITKEKERKGEGKKEKRREGQGS